MEYINSLITNLSISLESKADIYSISIHNKLYFFNFAVNKNYCYEDEQPNVNEGSTTLVRRKAKKMSKKDRTK